MKKEFHLLRGASQPEREAQRFLSRMSAATGQGYKVEACGAWGADGFYAIMSRPEGAEVKSTGAITKKELETVRAIADNDMNLSNAALELGLHRSTIQKRVDRIYTRTGLNPTCFYDLNELLYMEAEEDGKENTADE